MFDNIRGIVDFEAVAAEPETFLNILKQSSAAVSDVKYKNGKLSGKIYNSDLPQITALAEKNGVLFSIVGKRGSIFTIRKYRLRIGLAIGLFLAFAMVFYLSNIVMSIEIYGNETITDKQAEAILNDCGIRIGTFIPCIDLREIERQVVSSTENIAWIGIRSSGCIIQAEISEISSPPEMVPKNTPCNVVSSRDAQIVDIKGVYLGMLVPMLYDGVKKGDILVSGTVENGKGGVYFVHAMGEIIGRYNEKVTFSQPFSDEITDHKGTVTRKYLNFFGAKIPLFVGRNDLENYEYDETSSYFQILNIKLPIGTTTAEYKLFDKEEVRYTPEKAKQILEDKIRLYEMNFYDGEDITIVDKEVFFSENDKGMSVTVKYTIEGDIGVTKEIMAK